MDPGAPALTRRDVSRLAGALLVAQLRAANPGFPSRNIDFIIPKAPGGGFDSLVRVIAPPLENYLPRKVHVIPDNIPAGGGGKGISQLYRAAPDGYTLGVVDIPGSFILQAQQHGADFDLNKLTWLCSLGEPEYMCIAVGESSPLKSFEELRKLSSARPVKFTSSGPEGTAYAAALVGAALLGIRTQLITGYKGSSDYVIGAIRGDGDAVIASLNAIRPFEKAKTIRVLATFEPHGSFPGVPDAAALHRPELSKILLERMVAAPPGLPAGIKSILAAALHKSLADPKAVSLAKKLDVELVANSPEQTAERIQQSAAFFDTWKKYFL